MDTEVGGLYTICEGAAYLRQAESVTYMRQRHGLAWPCSFHASKAKNSCKQRHYVFLWLVHPHLLEPDMNHNWAPYNQVDLEPARTQEERSRARESRLIAIDSGGAV